MGGGVWAAIGATLAMAHATPAPFPLQTLLKDPEAARTFDYWRLRDGRTPAQVLALGDSVTKASRDGACQTDAEREIVVGLKTAAEARDGGEWRNDRDAGANAVLAYRAKKARILAMRPSGDAALDEAMAQILTDWRDAPTPRARALLQRQAIDQLPMQVMMVAAGAPAQKPGIETRLFSTLEQEECRNSHVLSGWLKTEVARHGWFTPRHDGKAAADAAFIIAQHADHDVAFQKSVLAKLEKLLPSGDLDRSHYAYLWDRIATHENRPQRYGTQSKGCVAGQIAFWPIEDPDHVDERRARFGMTALAEYRATLSKFSRCHA